MLEKTTLVLVSSSMGAPVFFSIGKKLHQKPLSAPIFFSRQKLRQKPFSAFFLAQNSAWTFPFGKNHFFVCFPFQSVENPINGKITGCCVSLLSSLKKHSHKWSIRFDVHSSALCVLFFELSWVGEKNPPMPGCLSKNGSSFSAS